MDNGRPISIVKVQPMTKSSAGAASNIACPFEDPGRSKKAIAVGPKILTAVGATCLTILVFTACVVAQQRSEIEQGAVMKARNLARAVAYRATAGAGSRQAYVQGLGDLYKRDFVIVDRQKKGLADADATSGSLRVSPNRWRHCSRTLRCSIR